jgi:lipopolysaccharide heptosyltransferase II
MSASLWADAKNLLCVRLDTLGDVLMTTPAIRALKQSAPSRRVTLLTSTPGSRIASLVPEIDAVVSYDPPWMKATPWRRGNSDLRLIEQLRDAQFDAVAIFTVFSQNPLPAALCCYLADIPLRLAHCRENPYQLLTDWIREPEPEQFIRHEVRRQLDLVAAVGATGSDERLSLAVPDEAKSEVVRLLDERGIDLDKPWLVIHAGATAASRRWPPELFAAAARELAAEHGFQLIFTGCEAERLLVETIRHQIGAPSLSLAGELELGALTALVALAPVLISNNSGPVHIAAAVGTPVVDLYALTNPQHTPWQVPHRVLSHDVPCKYCYRSICPEGHHDCLRLVEPRQVVAATLELLGETRPSETRSAETLLADSTPLTSTLPVPYAV